LSAKSAEHSFLFLKIHVKKKTKKLPFKFKWLRHSKAQYQVCNFIKLHQISQFERYLEGSLRCTHSISQKAISGKGSGSELVQ